MVNEIMELQKTLNKLGFDGLTINGELDENTVHSLMCFQDWYDLEVTGQYDNPTKNMIQVCLELYEEKRMSKETLIRKGQEAANIFAKLHIPIDGLEGQHNDLAKLEVLSYAMNLDYNSMVDYRNVVDCLDMPPFNKTFKVGHKQYMITAIKILLLLNGYNAGTINLPDAFTEELSELIRKYQEEHNLRETGECDINTMKSLVE